MLVTVRVLLRIRRVASLQRLLNSYLEGFPRFNLKRKEKGEGGVSVIDTFQPSRLSERGGRGTLEGTVRFVQSDVAVGSSVARIYRLLTSHIGELKKTPCFWAAFLSLFEKDNPFDWSQDRNSDRGGRCG